MSGKEYISGIEVIRLDETSSTNDVARTLAEERRLRAPLLVTARHQLAGRGRGGHRWLSSPGDDLLVTLLWSPRRLPASHQFTLSMAAALGTAQLVDLFIPGSTVKWPNDIITGGKKLAGILIENTIRDDHLETSLIGIGVNLNEAAFPTTLPDAISLRMLTGRHYDADSLLESLTGYLLNYLQQVDNGAREALHKEYEKRLCRQGEESLFRTNRGIITAIIAGVDDYGRLLLIHSDGETRPYNMDEIHQLL